MKKFMLSVIAFFIMIYSAIAGEVTLQWDTNDDADYYIIYYGTSPGNYAFTSENIVAPSTEYMAKDLAEGTWYFSVKAFNSCGNSSDFSDEVSTVIGAIVPGKPMKLKFEG